MTKVVGIRCRNVGKIYYFNPMDYDVCVNDHVIVETARGIEYGRVVIGPKDVKDEEVVHPLKEVLRVATPEDDEKEIQNRIKEREAFKICQKKSGTALCKANRFWRLFCGIAGVYDRADYTGKPMVAGAGLLYFRYACLYQQIEFLPE
jgi:hypothetical protein